VLAGRLRASRGGAGSGAEPRGGVGRGVEPLDVVAAALGEGLAEAGVGGGAGRDDGVGVLLHAGLGDDVDRRPVRQHDHLVAGGPQRPGDGVGPDDDDSERARHGDHTRDVPVARTEPSRALLAALVVVLGALLLVAVVLFLNSRDTSSGDGRFSELRAEDLLDRQASDGVPACFDDPVSGDRPICVFHAGDDPDTGWVAYDAQVGGCALEYRGRDDLRDSCTGETYPFTGDGLETYATEVEDGRLVIDLDGEEPTTTTTVVESGDVPN